jgi:hypothetical protein
MRSVSAPFIGDIKRLGRIADVFASATVLRGAGDEPQEYLRERVSWSTVSAAEAMPSRQRKCWFPGAPNGGCDHGALVSMSVTSVPVPALANVSRVTNSVVPGVRAVASAARKPSGR